MSYSYHLAPIPLANWYSIIETAKANDRDPFAYLKHLLTQLPLSERGKRS